MVASGEQNMEEKVWEIPGVEKKQLKSELYKTEMCRSFVEQGFCRYGEKCQFAHGEQELRPVLRHPKYRTKKCKNFEETGICTYGVRCRFIHERSRVDEKELGTLLSHMETGSATSAQQDEPASEEYVPKMPALEEKHVPLFFPDASASSRCPARGRLPIFEQLQGHANNRVM